MSRLTPNTTAKPVKKIKVNIARDNQPFLNIYQLTAQIKKPLIILIKRINPKLKIPVIILILLALGTISFFVIKPIFSNIKNTVDEKISQSQNDPQSTSPQYSTLTPNGNSIDQYGGWTRVSPSDKNPVFAFSTLVNGTKVIISEQPLPDDFKNDADVQTEQLAIGYKANEKITVSGHTIYIGTSANGPQSVIFHRDNLLILMKSSAKISNNDWIAFIESFK